MTTKTRTTKSTAVTVQSSVTFEIDMPNPEALGFDPTLPSFDWAEVLPDNYWSMESLTARRKSLRGWPVLTPAKVTVQAVFDPQDPEDKRDMSPKLVLYFEESSPALVLNKSRCQQLSDITRTRNPAQWVSKLGQVVLENGIYNGKAQICIMPVDDRLDGFDTDPSPDFDLDDVNQDLYG